MHSRIKIRDAGRTTLRTRSGVIVGQREWEESEKSVIEVTGWVKCFLRERGKIVPGSHREGKNTWTNTGREFITMLMSLQLADTKFRYDSIAYIGIGIGSQVEDPGVFQLIQPVAYTGGQFLAPLDIPPTFPLTPSKTTVRYHITFSETQITLTPGSQVNISELGLFTDGAPGASPAWNPGSRDTTLANAAQQAPMAYKALEPLGKTDSTQYDVSWEIRL